MKFKVCEFLLCEFFVNYAFLAKTTTFYIKIHLKFYAKIPKKFTKKDKNEILRQKCANHRG